MNVQDLIKKLSELPPESEVYVSERGRCDECNPMEYDYFHEVYDSDFGMRVEW